MHILSFKAYTTSVSLVTRSVIFCFFLSSEVGETDREFGVSRGVDFRFVSNILNFDFPVTPEDYVHRVGRTARCDQKGTALSLVSEAELPLLKAVQNLLTKHQAGKLGLF